jgi:GTP-binding protein
MIFEGPTRGIFGYRGQFMIDTRGQGIMATRFLEFRPYAGAIQKRLTGSMTTMETGKVLAFSLGNFKIVECSTLHQTLKSTKVW